MISGTRQKLRAMKLSCALEKMNKLKKAVNGSRLRPVSAPSRFRFAIIYLLCIPSTRHELPDVTCEGECLILYRISCTSSSW